MSQYFIASLGLRRLLGIEQFKVTKSDIAKALSYPDRIREECETFVRGEVSRQPIDLLSYEDLPEIKKALNNLNVGTLLPAIFPKLDKVDIGIDIAEDIVDIIKYLQDNMPSVPEDPLSQAGGDLSSSLSDDLHFLFICRLVDNPLHFLHLMQQSMLTNRDSAVLQDIYPEMLDHIVSSTISSVLEIKPNLNRPQKMMVSILLGIPVVNIKTLQAYQKEPPKEDVSRISQDITITSME